LAGLDRVCISQAVGSHKIFDGGTKIFGQAAERVALLDNIQAGWGGCGH
jgi:hypothetical protein